LEYTRRLVQCKQEPRIGLLITLAGVLGMAPGELLKPVEGQRAARDRPLTIRPEQRMTPMPGRQAAPVGAGAPSPRATGAAGPEKQVGARSGIERTFGA